LTRFQQKQVLAVIVAREHDSNKPSPRGQGGSLVVLDLHTGVPVFPASELEIGSVVTPLLVDLKGDGQLEAVLLHREDDVMTLTAMSLNGTSIWEHRFGENLPEKTSLAANLSNSVYATYKAAMPRLLVSDMDGNGKKSLVVACDIFES